MCSTAHRENYRNSLRRILDHPIYVDIEVLSFIAALLIKATLIDAIIPLSKKLSIVFCTVFNKYYGVKESQNSTLLDRFSAPCWHGHNNSAYFSFVLRQN